MMKFVHVCRAFNDTIQYVVLIDKEVNTLWLAKWHAASDRVERLVEVPYGDHAQRPLAQYAAKQAVRALAKNALLDPRQAVAAEFDRIALQRP